jgi:cytochrome c oxidase cbb3-type subunit 3
MERTPLALVLVVLCVTARAQIGARRPVSENPLVKNRAAVEAGERRFKQLCASCHGTRGEGGQGEGHGPNLVTSWEVRRASDERLHGFIRKGVPGTAMPPFSLPDEQIVELSTFVRSLNAPAMSMPVRGDPVLGEVVFNGKGGCSSCHLIKGRGGYLGPDLSDAGATFRLDEFRSAILRRGTLPTNGYRPVMVRIAGQESVRGVVRHESPWSLQILDETGQLNLLHGAEMKQVGPAGKSWMPDDYGKRLTAEELDNLIAYLSRQAVRPAGPQEPANHTEPQ